MNMAEPSGTRSIERMMEIVAAGLLHVALGTQPLSAAEYISMPDVEFLESIDSAPMMDRFPPRPCWNHRGGTNYGMGAVNHTRNHSFRLPVCPPIYDPAFGFRFTCWRQLSYERRCLVPETNWHRPSMDLQLQQSGRVQMDKDVLLGPESAGLSRPE